MRAVLSAEALCVACSRESWLSEVVTSMMCAAIINCCRRRFISFLAALLSARVSGAAMLGPLCSGYGSCGALILEQR